MQQIQGLARQMIIDDLIMLGCILGQMSISEFVRKVYPKASDMPTSDRRFEMSTTIDDIHQHMVNNDDWDYEFLFYKYLDFLKMDDSDFEYFLEHYIHPSIKRFDFDDDTFEKIRKSNAEYVEVINKYLTGDGFERK